MRKALLAMTFLWVMPALSSASETYPPATVEMVLQQVSDHCYYVQGRPGIATDNQGFISNAGFVATPEGVVVFDSLGSPSLAWLMLDKIRQVTDKPVVKVIVSHYHADHIYGLQVFKKLGAEIIGPEGAYKYLDSPLAMERLEERRFSLEPWVNDATRLVPPDRSVSERLQFKLGGVSFTIDYLGDAHSDGDMSMFVEPDGVLFSGDIIFEGRVPFVGAANTRHWLETLQRMQLGKLAALIPGHGPAAKDPNQAVNLTLRYLAYLRDVMGEAVQEFVPFEEAYSEADWSEFASLPAFEAANRRNAYQVFLSMEAESLDQ